MMIPWIYAWLPLTIVLGYTWLRFESKWWRKKLWLGFQHHVAHFHRADLQGHCVLLVVRLGQEAVMKED